MLQAWLSFGYIVLLAILVLAFILWRRGSPVLAIAALVVGIPLWFGWEYARPTWTTGVITGTEVRRSDPDAREVFHESEVRIRAIRPSDKQALADGMHRLSAESAYFRFFGPKHELGAKELAFFTEIDPTLASTDFFAAVQRARGPVSAYYLLASVDLARNAAGEVERVAEANRIYLEVLARTLGISLSVTVLCLLMGFPVALLLTQAELQRERGEFALLRDTARALRQKDGQHVRAHEDL